MPWVHLSVVTVQLNVFPLLVGAWRLEVEALRPIKWTRESFRYLEIVTIAETPFYDVAYLQLVSGPTGQPLAATMVLLQARVAFARL